MRAYLARRVVHALVTAAGIAVVSFLVLYARPDATCRDLGQIKGVKSPTRLAEMCESYGLDRSPAGQLTSWIGGAVRGDLGQSWSRPHSVVSILWQHLPLTLALTCSGLFLQLLFGVAQAAYSVRKRGSPGEVVSNVVTLSLYSMPEFCLGLLFVWVFAITLGWFPFSGASRFAWEGTVSIVERLHHLALPALTLSLGGVAVVSRLLRVRWIEESGEAYVAAARARGVTSLRVLWKHSLRNAAGPLCVSVGLSLPALVGGAVVVERVFNWPGLGTVLVDSIQARDLPVLAGVNLVLALLVCLGGLLSDVLWMALDPRQRRP